MEGTVAEELNYEHDVPSGVRKLFFVNGGLESESEYKDGKLNGFHRVYYPSGKLMIDATQKQRFEWHFQNLVRLAPCRKW